MSTLRVELTLEIGWRRSTGQWVAIATTSNGQRYVSPDYPTEAEADAEGARMVKMIRTELPRALAEHGFEVSVTLKGRESWNA